MYNNTILIEISGLSARTYSRYLSRGIRGHRIKKIKVYYFDEIRARSIAAFMGFTPQLERYIKDQANGKKRKK